MSADRPKDRLDAHRLAEFAMLAGVGLTARQEIALRGVHRRLSAGEVLLEAGQPNDHMYFVLEGRLGIHLDSIDSDPIAHIEPGETVGELSVLDGSPTSAFVVATEPSHLLALDEQVFWTLTNDSHAFAVNMLLKLVQRLRANNAAVSENVKQRRQFERAAMFDGLTGIHNRRWLDDTLNRLVDRNNPDGERRAARIHAPSALSLALLDIDHFKRFNDTYGHAAGDQVLTAVARTLTDNLRPTDLVARFGGEEFVIIFPDTDIGQAVIAAERVRLSIAATEVCTLNGQPLPRVTVSIGIAQLAPGQSVKDFLEVADQALYRAKDAGRNRVVH